MLNNLTNEQKQKLTSEQQKNLILWSKRLNMPVENIGWRVGTIGCIEEKISFSWKKIKNWIKRK